MPAANPLTAIRLPVPFDEIRPEHVRPAIGELLAAAQARLADIAAPAPRTYANTLGALDTATETLDYAMGVVRHLEAVATSDELRDAVNEVQPRVSAFYASIPLHAGLWSALQEFAATPEAGALTGIERRFLTKTLDSFRRHGAGLDAAGKQRLEALSAELATLTNRFAQNVVDATAAFELCITEESRLAGLPPSAVAAARQSAESKGQAGWRFTLHAPSYLAAMTYLDDAGVREQLWRAYNRRAADENFALIGQILKLRREQARLLGYADFADFTLADRMAKTGAAAKAFVADLEARTAAWFERENAGLAHFSARAALEPWDVGYYAEKQRQAEYAFDEEDLRPYFPLGSVVAGLFELLERLYGVRITEHAGVPVWHADVKFYDIRDGDGTLLGGFYADWHPRDTKRGGAWMDALVTGGAERPHIGLMCGNLTPPLAGKPSLLTHREVETIFHEMGHLTHHLLSRVPIRSFAGTQVAWDFVELPSQIMENWCWEKECLDLFARHWETGARIPEELFAKMQRARTFRAANGQMRQLGFGTVDLKLHTEFESDAAEAIAAYAREVLGRFTPAPLPADYAMLAGFTHLFADPVGYGAGYYSYKWAEVLDADAFSRFRAEGIFNRATGMAFRQEILARGDSEDPALLFRNFMGREPDPAALFRRLGLGE